MTRQPWFDSPTGGLSAAEWDGVAGCHFYSSSFWLTLCTLEWPESGGIHVDLPGGGRAAVPVIPVTAGAHPNLRWNDLLRARGLPVIAPHGLYVGQVRGYLTHLLASVGASRQMAATALLEAIRDAELPTGSVGGSLVAAYLTTEDVTTLRSVGVQTLPVLLDLDASIHIPAGGRSAWLNSLSSHRARRIRAEARRFFGAGYTLTHHTLGDAYADVARLSAHTVAKYQPLPSENPFHEGFKKQGEFAGDHARVLRCSLDGETVGCCLYYRHADTIYLRSVGFDYSLLRSASEYATLSYYVPAGWAGVGCIHAGIGSAQAKALRGATLEPLWLLDLSTNSELKSAEQEIRSHNRDAYTAFAYDSPAVAAALASDGAAQFW